MAFVVIQVDGMDNSKGCCQKNLKFQSPGLLTNVSGYGLWISLTALVQSYLPRFLEKTKENQGAERLPSKISGCIIYSGNYEHKRKCLFYINHDQVWFYFFINISTIDSRPPAESFTISF